MAEHVIPKQTCATTPLESLLNLHQTIKLLSYRKMHVWFHWKTKMTNETRMKRGFISRRIEYNLGQPAHQEQLGLQGAARGRFNLMSGWSTNNPLITRQPLYLLNHDFLDCLHFNYHLELHLINTLVQHQQSAVRLFSLLSVKRGCVFSLYQLFVCTTLQWYW